MTSPAPRTAFVVCVARSGTTLLRHVLDGHPEIACPGEAGIPSLIGHLARVWYVVAADREGGHVPDPPAVALDGIRESALRPMCHYCAAENKSLYVDKSLDSAEYLEITHKVLPESRYLLIFRHVLDVVASGLEASPWGFTSFGYAPYVEHSVANFVAPLVQHWNFHVHLALEWEKKQPTACKRVRYEDLVRDPETVVTDVFRFLDVPPDLSTLDRALTRARLATTPGDLKIGYSDRIERDTVGRGKQIPISMIPPEVLRQTNAHLAALGYDEITENWNLEPHQGRTASAPNVWIDALERLMPDRLDEDVCSAGFVSFAIVADDRPGVRWEADPSSGRMERRDEGSAGLTICGSARDLVEMISGDENMAILLRTGRIRYGFHNGSEGLPETATLTGVREALRTSAQVAQDG